MFEYTEQTVYARTSIVRVKIFRGCVMIILHQIGKPVSDDFKKMYIVRKLDDDIKRQKFIHVPELSPSQILFEKYRELARNNLWNEQTFQSVYLPVF